jgi:hypothetical protein
MNPLIQRRLVAALALAIALGTTACTRSAAPPVPTTPEPAWQLVAADLPAALLSVDGLSDTDVLAVGADKGRGPLVLHFDGKAWSELDTGQRGDLWWVHMFGDGSAILGGAGALLLRYEGGHFERLEAPRGLARQTVYGVWGPSPRDFYAVGSSSGRNGFLWRYHDGVFHDVALPADLPLGPMGVPPGFFKVWGEGDDVWVVGALGTILHRTGDEPFKLVPSGTKDTLFTVHGSSKGLIAVGGSSNGVALEPAMSGAHDVSPNGSALIQGAFSTDSEDWMSGERGAIFRRKRGEAFHPIEHGLPLPVTSSLHSICVDGSHGVWAAGGNVLTPAMDGGLLVHFGAPVPEYVPEEHSSAGAAGGEAGAEATCPVEVVCAGKDGSIARRWNEQALAAIRLDLPRPTVHARNLFHLSAAMWDAWSAYDHVATGVFVRERQHPEDVDEARRKAISYAAYGVLAHRYKPAIGGARTVACLRSVMRDLGLDPDDAHDTGEDPVAFGNRVAHQIVAKTAADGANEAGDYEDPQAFKSPNAPLVYDNPGTAVVDPNVWQPINLAVAATQNGIILPAGVQDYIGSQWGGVVPFALHRASGNVPWVKTPKAPRVGSAMKQWIIEVIQKQSDLDPSDGVTMDLSPGGYGHNSLGANDGMGWKENPVTGKPYAPQTVLRADFGRVLAEFWADGPKSETPPGHWNVLANFVSDSSDFGRRLFGKGESLDRLAWDVHVYLALNGAEHDAAIAAWDGKRREVTSRPIALIRWMGGKGQSSDPSGPSYSADGLPLVPGLIEVITTETSQPGQRHERLARYVGQTAVRGWLGEPGDRAKQVSGVGWIRAVDWVPYQRRTFVTPAFPGYISGHSTFSRAGAEVLTALTGSPYFPGGLGEYVAPAGTFLTFENGPTREVHLQWAAYSDASDQAGQSRIWGGIHIEPDDFVGRRIGAEVGKNAVARALKFFDGGS